METQSKNSIRKLCEMSDEQAAQILSAPIDFTQFLDEVDEDMKEGHIAHDDIYADFIHKVAQILMLNLSKIIIGFILIAVTEIERLAMKYKISEGEYE